MEASMIRRSSMGLVWVVLLTIAAACSASNPQPQVVPPAATGGSPSVPLTNTLPPAAPTNTPAPPAPTTELPQPSETSAPTATPTPTPKPRLPAATARPRNTVTPLNVSYQVVEIKRTSGEQAALV